MGLTESEAEVSNGDWRLFKVSVVSWTVTKLGLSAAAGALVVIGLFVGWPAAAWEFGFALLLIEARLLVAFADIGVATVRSEGNESSGARPKRPTTPRSPNLVKLQGLTYCSVFAIVSAGAVVMAGYASGGFRVVGIGLSAIFTILTLVMGNMLGRIVRRTTTNRAPEGTAEC